MNKRSRPKTGRQVENKSPQGAAPDDNKPQVICKEAQGPGDEPAAQGLVVEDEDWIRLEYERSRLKEALGGIGDDAFCDGLLHQLKRLFPFEDGPESVRNFDFVLSVIKDAKPIDTLQANLAFQMAICQLAITRQSEFLLKPIEYQLPYDVAVALHRADWNAGAVKGKRRCRMHGGAAGSGAPRGNKNALKHGAFTQERMQERRQIRAFLQQTRALIQKIPHP